MKWKDNLYANKITILSKMKVRIKKITIIDTAFQIKRARPNIMTNELRMGGEKA